jgi:hypothetical protein
VLFGPTRRRHPEAGHRASPGRIGPDDASAIVVASVVPDAETTASAVGASNHGRRLEVIVQERR